MRLDTANRSFFSLLLLALGPYLLVGVWACGTLSVALYDFAAGGLEPLADTPAGWTALIFLAAAAAGAVAAILSLCRQAVATRRLVAFVRAGRVSAPVHAAEAAARSGIGHLVAVADDRPYAFTFGLLTPRVVVSTGLLEATTGVELEAVLAHERYHVANLDPLKAVAARAVPAAFFFLPALAHLGRRYTIGRELAADRRAVRRTGVTPIASALYKTANAPTPPLLASAAAIGGRELLEARVAQLESGDEPAMAAVPPAAIAATVLGLVATAAGIAVILGSAGESGVSSGNLRPDLLGGVACGALWLVGGGIVYRRFGAGR